MPAPTAPETGGFVRWRHGWVFGVVWLLFLVEPLQDARRAGDAATSALGVTALVLFAVLYVVLLRRWMGTGGGLRVGVELREAVLGAVGLAVLGSLVVPAAGVSATNTVVFVCAYGVFALPRRAAIGLVTLVCVGLSVLARSVPGWESASGTTAAVVLSSVAVYGISRMVLRGRQLALAQQDLARLAVVEERARVARDLHDLLGHSLTVITLKAELAGRLLDADPARARGEVEDVERLARTALSDVRAALEGYREVSLGAELAGARQALAAAGVTAHLPTAVDEVPAEAQELFGWAVREGVTNVVRHSGARTCWIAADPARLTVEDDGRGPREGAGDGRGLAGLAERARDAGGSLAVSRSARGGFRLEVGAP